MSKRKSRERNKPVAIAADRWRRSSIIASITMLLMAGVIAAGWSMIGSGTNSGMNTVSPQSQPSLVLDQLPEPIDESEEWYKHARANGHEVCGWYTPKEKSTPAYITLHIRDIYRAVPCAYWWTTVPTLLITRVLAHEVAHHLVAKRGYIFKRGERLNHREYEEAAANRYAFGVIEKMQERRFYKIGRWLIKDLADHHYIIGMLDWKEKKYSKAADRWYKAWCLNPNLDEAAYWYWRAREMSVPNQK